MELKSIRNYEEPKYLRNEKKCSLVPMFINNKTSLGLIIIYLLANYSYASTFSGITYGDMIESDVYGLVEVESIGGLTGYGLLRTFLFVIFCGSVLFTIVEFIKLHRRNKKSENIDEKNKLEKKRKIIVGIFAIVIVGILFLVI